MNVRVRVHLRDRLDAWDCSHEQSGIPRSELQSCGVVYNTTFIPSVYFYYLSHHG